MVKRLILSVAAVLALYPSAPAEAETISVGTTNVDVIGNAGSFADADFASLFVGSSWELQTTDADGGTVLTTSFSAESSGMEGVAASPDSFLPTFMFVGADWATVQAQYADAVTVASSPLSGPMAEEGDGDIALLVDNRLRRPNGDADAAPVPEPATMTLLGLGLAGIGARCWRQRNAS